MMGYLSSLGSLLRAAWVLTRHDALLPKEYQSLLPAPVRWLGQLGRLVADPHRQSNPGVRLARALEKLGPAYVKLGQFLATRGDILDPDFVDGLSTLKDKAEPFPVSTARKVLEGEFGDQAKVLFPHLSAAVAAASIAQVHKLPIDGGAPLAIKVLRPGVEAKVARDLKAFRLAAGAIERLIPASLRLRPRAFVETVARALTLETDLRLEAASAGEMAEIAKDIDNFVVPKVDWIRTERRVLAIQWIDGAPLSDPLRLNALGVDQKALAVTAIRAFLHSALNQGVFHADMHEGNLFANAKGDLVAIDFGIIGRIGAAERRYLAEILYGFITRNYQRIAEVHFEAGYVPAHHNVADFASALRAVGEPIWGKRSSDVSMGRLLLQLFEITDLFDMALRPELVLLQKTMVQVEGVARGLDPNFDMWAAASPVVETWVTRELGPIGLAKSVSGDLSRLRRAAERLPEVVDALAALSGNSPMAGLSLSDDTIARLMTARMHATRLRFWGLWALALIAVIGLAWR